MDGSRLDVRMRRAGKEGASAWDGGDATVEAVLASSCHLASSLRPVTMLSTPLPPAMCGIGSYTAMLARYWPDPSQVVHFVTTGAEASRLASPCPPIFEVRPASDALSGSLSELPTNDVLIQYAARGFSRLGVPLWLLRAMQGWRRRVPQRRLAIFIHELWADLPLIHRRGMLERFNRWIIRELASISDVVMTNTVHHQHRLESMLGGRKVLTIPVGTNFLPPSEVSSIRERNPGAFAIFGRAFGRVQTLQRLYPHLQRWHASGVLRKLHLVGPLEDRWEHDEAELIHRLLPPHVVHRHGPLPDAAVSQLLSTSPFALSGQARSSLMKSTTFMAFASHGCCVIDAESHHADDEKVCRVGVLDAAQLVEGQGAMNLAVAKADALRLWHQENASWPVISCRVAAAMEGNV